MVCAFTYFCYIVWQAEYEKYGFFRTLCPTSVGHTFRRPSDTPSDGRRTPCPKKHLTERNVQEGISLLYLPKKTNKVHYCMIETGYKYFNRDISWLSFNYRVLQEAEDRTLPIYERIKFLSIHASNLEEFYKVRVAEYRNNAPGKNEEILSLINKEAIRQQRETSRIFNEQLLPALAENNIILYQDHLIESFHRQFVRNFFEEEIFPYLQPVIIMKGDMRMFLRDNRLYTAIRMIKEGRFYYAIMKIPYAKVPRFVVLPSHNGKYYIMFIDDIISANLPEMFPGFLVDGNYSIKISRDSDIFVEEANPEELVKDIMQKVKRRKIGKVSRFVYDRSMPQDMVVYLCETFGLKDEDLIPGGRHLNMEDLIKLPNPVGKSLTFTPPPAQHIPQLDKERSLLDYIGQTDILLNYPYQSFDYFLRFLKEAAFDQEVEEIKLTQYRVAENSEVIETLILAAQQKKRVTVFVEIKARFDEENNWHTSELMKHAGIHIVFSLPKLKVHAKLALIVKRKSFKNKNIAYLSTGNFNEKTAQTYADMGLFTANKEITNDSLQLFSFLEQKIKEPVFNRLLISQFNMLPELLNKIEREIQHAKAGRKTHIILKMNGIQDERMIDTLYRASEAGVQIDMIVRGICCVIPQQAFSKNIRITRIVDMYLEHARVWYFFNAGAEDIYISSADWLKRNLGKRIESAAPVLSPQLKQEVREILQLQLSGNVKACWVDDQLRNIRKSEDSSQALVRTQEAMYQRFLSDKH